jgi:hypothetical protein
LAAHLCRGGRERGGRGRSRAPPNKSQSRSAVSVRTPAMPRPRRRPCSTRGRSCLRRPSPRTRLRPDRRRGSARPRLGAAHSLPRSRCRPIPRDECGVCSLRITNWQASAMEVHGGYDNSEDDRRRGVRRRGPAGEKTATKARRYELVQRQHHLHHQGRRDVPVGAPAHESGFCVFVCDENAPGGAAWLCQGGFELPGGQIHSRVLADFSKGGPDFVVHAAILGGTGVYKRAMGEIETTWHSAAKPKTKMDWVMTIES